MLIQAIYLRDRGPNHRSMGAGGSHSMRRLLRSRHGAIHSRTRRPVICLHLLELGLEDLRRDGTSDVAIPTGPDDRHVAQLTSCVKAMSHEPCALSLVGNRRRPALRSDGDFAPQKS